MVVVIDVNSKPKLIMLLPSNLVSCNCLKKQTKLSFQAFCSWVCRCQSTNTALHHDATVLQGNGNCIVTILESPRFCTNAPTCFHQTPITQNRLSYFRRENHIVSEFNALAILILQLNGNCPVVQDRNAPTLCILKRHRFTTKRRPTMDHGSWKHRCICSTINNDLGFNCFWKDFQRCLSCSHTSHRTVVYFSLVDVEELHHSNWWCSSNIKIPQIKNCRWGWCRWILISVME